MTLINVPTEHVYFHEETTTEETTGDRKRLVERDPIKLNRFWFQYPPEWRTSSQSERIVGVRSLWISKVYRHLRYIFLFKKVLIEDPTKITECEITIHSWWDYDKDLRQLWIDFKIQFNQYIDKHKDEWVKAGTPVLDFKDFRQDCAYQYKNSDLSFCQWMFCTNLDPACNCFFNMKDFNLDAQYILNVPKDYDSKSWKTNLLFFDVWDRHSILIESSLASNTVRNYVGFSEVRYNPIKYFKINSADARFWIDLYQGHQHNVPSILPLDNKEALVLELIVLDNANQLY